jgi:hypothetical protein
MNKCNPWRLDGSGFLKMSQVKDIIDGIKHRLPDRTNIYPALNRAVSMVNKRLKYHDSSMIKGALSVTITADSASGSMPSDYWGLLGKPYISGETYFLEPIPNQETKLNFTDNTTPRWYEIIGTTIYLYPGTSTEATLIGPYWQKSTALTKSTDTMTFSELFDDAIQESLIHTYITGESTGNPVDISMIRNFINTAVDEIVPGIEQKIPTRITEAVNYDSMMWGV